MIFAYVVPILLVILIYRYWQLKKSIRNNEHDYSYYEEGPYGERKKEPKGIIAKIKKALGFKDYCLLIFLLVGLGSCKKNNPTNNQQQYATGVFCVNEGIFGQTSGTISYFNRDDNSTSEKVFHQANDRDLGNVVQSMRFIEGMAYIVVNNSNKIEVAQADNFKEVTQITGLKQPRHLVSADDLLYVSQWGNDGLTGSIAIINKNSHLIISVVPVGKGPERLLHHNNKLYIPNTGGYDVANEVVVMNTATNSIEKTITVDDNPTACLTDVNGYVWVLCGGSTTYSTYPNIDTSNSTTSSLIKIDTATNTVVYRHAFGKGKAAANLTVSANGYYLYYCREGKVWKHDIFTNTETPLFDGNYYGLGYDPSTDYLYASTNAGIDKAWTKRYTADGVLVDSFQVGVFANGFVFR